LFVPDSDPDFLPIPYPGSRGQKGTGSRVRIRNTGKKDEKVDSEGLRYGTYLGNNVQRFLVASSKLREIVVRISGGFLHLIHPPTVTETDQIW
jgi:hypothetical protein